MLLPTLQGQGSQPETTVSQSAGHAHYLDAVQLHHGAMLAVSHHRCLYYFSESHLLNRDRQNLESDTQRITHR